MRLPTTLGALAFYGLASVAGSAETGQTPAANPEAPVIEGKGKCNPGRKAYRYADTGVFTSSATEEVMPESTVRFKQGGNKPDCVIVELTASARAPGSGTGLIVSARLGAKECGPSDVVLVSNSDTHGSSHAVTWICTDVSPGKRKVRIMWRSLTASTVTVVDRMIVVHYQ